ncbi:MAG: SDR family NAD(P)-dependent oxidoreductase, partial [Actinomycetota bacterium]|nr:SDR family NAD(P)-dependent oxidoreductase [Actinomycetota bacterium]
MNISGKTALVTGGASGLGQAAARALVAAGASVVVADLPGSDGEVVAKELGERTRFAATDVTDEAEVRAAIEAACRHFDGLHIVVNCAGVGFPGRVLTRDGEPSDLARFELVVRVNLIGTFNVLRLAAAAIARNEPEDGERGVIVNTASIAAFDGQVGQAAYSASKGGIVGMT